MVKPPAVTTALQKLTSPEVRQVVQLVSGKYRLTDLGSKRIREKLPDKLLLT
jgi:Mn-dependent DtxR family transcriptional regulator